MGHSVTLGGDRVGSGNKNKIYLHNYERSTHNLSTDFESTMGCGMLIPFMCELVTRDDKYEIDLSAGLRTIPTKGPLFGSFKLQLDVYQCPLRLYQALLHNNPLAIGLKASQVKFPKMRLYGNVSADPTQKTTIMSSNNSLVKYLGISGIGTAKGNEDEVTYRDMFGAGVLAYYDIFKNYYANKQEENAYTLSVATTRTNRLFSIYYQNTDFKLYDYLNKKNVNELVNEGNNEWLYISGGFNIVEEYQATHEDFNIADWATADGDYTIYMHTQADEENNSITEEDAKQITLGISWTALGSTLPATNDTDTIENHIKKGNIVRFEMREGTLIIGIRYKRTDNQRILSGIAWKQENYYYDEQITLLDFPLENIDKMRYNILSFHQLGQSYQLDGQSDLDMPYLAAIGNEYDIITNKKTWQTPLAGICVKTYQSDLFNNWLNTEVIDGENGIAAITAIDTTEGSITIDALQFSEKLYNLLNRIAVSGGTYEDYLDAAYTESHKRFNESPIWIGGMSDEIIFEEILQTAPTENQPLGTIGGRGNLTGKQNGGKITVKIDEPSLLIGIVSITPRIVYTQGNMWFNTEIDSLADIHVPALDAIGFQNLIGEQLHAGSTIINSDKTLEERPIIGKVPAWINYMTNFDRAYGDFAAPDGDGFMVLQRQYELANGVIQDATTYIDPAKYNYAFAYTKREAQNFWVKIKCDIKARRLMSAKQIPTA